MNEVLHLTPQTWIGSLLGAVALAAVAWLGGRLTRRVRAFAARLSPLGLAWRWIDVLSKHGMFRWLARLAPSLVIQFGIGLVPGVSDPVLLTIFNIAQGMTLFTLAMAISSALSAAEDMYLRSGGRRSIRGLVQILKLVLFTVAALIIVGEIIGQNIGRHLGVLLSGVGAMSAVLMLLFKDTILGFVADIQLSANDMLRLGDRITMPGVGMDGEVIDISLHTVKVRNFDNTVITVPTWRLIGDSYQNWRGMTDAGTRRIKRELSVDASRVRFLADEEIAALLRFRLLRPYLESKHTDIVRWNEALGQEATVPVNRRRQTNIGAFRAYALAYLKAHPEVHAQMTCMVRMGDPTAQGVPLEIYAFTRTTVWEDYEGIQADIFDHLIAILPEFSLALFQPLSGGDVRAALPGARP
jgi:miniconductance mechanosensitive channel